jgi:hypothetical protein
VVSLLAQVVSLVGRDVSLVAQVVSLLAQVVSLVGRGVSLVAQVVSLIAQVVSLSARVVFPISPRSPQRAEVMLSRPALARKRPASAEARSRQRWLRVRFKTPERRGNAVAVVLDPDVASVFDSATKVNALLRSVISALPDAKPPVRVRTHRRKAG